MTSAARAATPLLFAEHVHKRFAGVHALRDAHLDVAAGEIHALVGENGAGKSTIINILAGAVKRDEGSVTFDGRLVDFESPAESQAAGISVIHQELATLPTMSVAENVCMSRLPTKGGGWWLDRRAMRATTRELLDVVGLDVDPETLVRELSPSHQQLVEIAKALGAGARLLVMDEPTASLTEHEALRLHALTRQLRDRGTAILFVSHRLSEVFAISDRITVFRDGSHVATLPTALTTPEEIVELMVGRAMSFDSMISAPPADAPIVLEVRGLTRRNPMGPSLDQVNLTVRRGEIVGLAGLVGAGRSELARAIVGDDSYDAGVVLVDGAPVRFRSPADALRTGVAMVPEDRTTLAMFPEQPVRANISMAVLPRLRKRRLVSRRAERALANDYVGRLHVTPRDIEAPVRALSGGNQQKTVLARWLATRPKLLILDEPTHGVDVGAKAEIHELIRELARDGIAILLISSELPEILALSARIVVLREGRVVATLSHDEANERVVMLHATGSTPTTGDQS